MNNVCERCYGDKYNSKPGWSWTVIFLCIAIVGLVVGLYDKDQRAISHINSTLPHSYSWKGEDLVREDGVVLAEVYERYPGPGWSMFVHAAQSEKDDPCIYMGTRHFDTRKLAEQAAEDCVRRSQ
jgi:hypothetical protein